ncbi:MAG: hypothetical protein GWP61_01210 [Chloroflexi bacterium]|jgi:hypothetical protein|nr:hypothetical protein [Chloroflexota bacterium]
MTKADDILHRLLDYLELRIDLDHVDRLTTRHRAAMNFEEIDRPPLVCYLPYEGDAFKPYPLSEIFDDPAKMMVNELLAGFTSIYHAVDLMDDAPYCLRPNLGVTIIASMLGAQIRVMEEQPPWVLPLDNASAIRRIVDGPIPSTTEGLAPRVLEQYDYYKMVLAGYPKCQAAFQLTLPDLQGPFDIVELLWGPDAFMAFYTEPELLEALLERITATILVAYRRFGAEVSENIGEGFQFQHATAVKGRILLRSDTTIMISPEHYQRFILPHDATIGQALGSVAIHFCGNGQHQLQNMLSTPNLSSLDLGQPWLMDMDTMYTLASAAKVGLVRLTLPDEQMTAEQLARRFPTGASFVYYAKTVAEARQRWQHYIGDS